AETAVRLARGDEDRPRHAFCGLGDAWLAAERGSTLARLGNSAEAREALDTALRLGGPDMGRVDLWLLLSKARTYVHDEEPEQASHMAGEVALAARELHFDLVA